VTTVVVERATVEVAARMAADDALGIQRPSTDAVVAAQPATAGGMQVAAAEPAQAGLFDGVVGAVLGFLFG
jgi:hypothetical protein